MTYAQKVKKYIDEYGRFVQYSQDGNAYTDPYKAFVQPLRYKNKMYLDGKHSEIGYIDTSYYLYIGPAEVNVLDNDISSRLKIGDKVYNFTHTEVISIGEEAVYVWAVIRQSFLS